VTGSGTIATSSDQVNSINVSGLNDGSLTLSVTLTDPAGNTSNAETATSVLDQTNPSISGTAANQAVDDNNTIQPFSSVSISDVHDVSVTITLDDNTKGTLSGAGLSGSGPYTISSTDSSSISSILQGLTFDPRENQLTPGTTETTQFTIDLTDAADNSSNDTTTTVVTTSVNDDPVIAGAQSSQTVDDTSTVFPFTSVTISDVDSPAQTQTVSVTFDDSAKGVFTPASLTASGFTDAGSGVYTFSGTATESQTAIRQLEFDPTENRNRNQQPQKQQRFTISVNDGVSSAVTDNTTTVDVTPVNDNPVLTINDSTILFESSAIIIDGTATLTDADNADFNTGTITVSFSSGSTTNDSLTVMPEGDGTGQIDVDGSNLEYEGNVIGTLNGGSSGNPFVISFSGTNATEAAPYKRLFGESHLITQRHSPSRITVSLRLL
jgi:hypothetical protein